MTTIKLKAFFESKWYARQPDGSLSLLVEREGTPLSTQVNQWVEETGAVLVHPGQPGMETTWYTDGQEQQSCCVTVGLTVLYQDGGSGVRPESNAGAAGRS